MTKLTKAQVAALDTAFSKGGAWYAKVRKMGGAYRRCIDRLVAVDLLDAKAPYKITLDGLRALRDVRAKAWADRGCVAYQVRLQAVEKALEVAQ